MENGKTEGLKINPVSLNNWISVGIKSYFSGFCKEAKSIFYLKGYFRDDDVSN